MRRSPRPPRYRTPPRTAWHPRFVVLTTLTRDDEAGIATAMDDCERSRYIEICRYVERFAMSNIKQHTRDHDLADQRVRKLPAQMRLAGLSAEQRREGLRPGEELLLLLSDEALRALDPAYIATLSDDVQQRVRARIGDPSRGA